MRTEEIMGALSAGADGILITASNTATAAAEAAGTPPGGAHVALEAALLLIAGAGLGAAVAWFVTRGLAAIGADSWAGETGFTGLLRQSGYTAAPSSMAGKALGGAVFIVFAAISVETLNISAFESIGKGLFLYLVNVFVALVILLAGYMIGNFLGRAALISAVGAGMGKAGVIGGLVKYFVVFLSVSIAAEHLGIGKDTLALAFGILFGGIVFALSLAFGLGGQQLAKEYLEKIFKEKTGNDGDIEHL